MTLRDFLKANKSLTDFKKLYHERSKTKITYRQIEANLLTAGEDFIINALHISITDCDYWVTLNTKWNDQLKLKASLSTNKTLGYWLKINNLEEKFKNAFLKQYPQGRNDLNQILTSTKYDTIASSFQWSSTSEGYNFWKKQHIAWNIFCKKINNE